MADLITPYGGDLVDLRVDSARAEELRKSSRDWPEWDLTPRQLCDLELLISGGFSPLRGFMGQEDHERVCSEMRLADGTLWPMPIALDADEAFARELDEGTPVALRDPEGVMLGVLHVEQVWEQDRETEARRVFGTSNPEHPGVGRLLHRTHPYYLSGEVEAIQLPVHHDFLGLRRTPAELRERFSQRGWERIVAFQTRNPMHRAHVELTRRAAEEVDARLLINPVVGMTKPGDVDHYTRVRVYQALLGHYPPDMVELSLLPLAMRMGGPREALWHAIIRRNHGCSHLIVGRDHAGPGSDSSGRPFYGPYDAQDLLREHQDEIGVEMVPFRLMVYVPSEEAYRPIDEIPDGIETLSISGTELRERLEAGAELPEWFTFPEVAEELRRTYPPRDERGIVVFFTGLSGSGKSTVANALLTKILERGGRHVTLLDGDLVRKHLSSELGFSKEHRDLNITRIGFVAAEIAKHGGTAICAPIAPYDATRREVRRMVEETGAAFVLVHVATPLEVAEQRDRKGLYAKARAGVITGFTGIDDPYEEPSDAEVTIDTTSTPPDEAAAAIVDHLLKGGYLRE